MNVTVRVGKLGFLAFRFYVGRVKDVQVGIELRDTPENRRRLEAHDAFHICERRPDRSSPSTSRTLDLDALIG